MKRTRRIRPVASLAEWKGLHRPGNPPKILCDQEVRTFIDEALTKMTFKETAEAVREKFGQKRAPSMTAIHRYYQASKQKRRSAK